MFQTIKKLFNRTKNKLYYIEIDDEQLNKEIIHIIIHMEQEIKQFRKTIDDTTWQVRDEELQHLFQEMTQIREDVNKIAEDINKIVGLKLHNMKYFIVKDDSYLIDKKKILESMKISIHTFLEIIEARPGRIELKRGLLQELVKQLNRIEKEIRNIISDDINLQQIYKKMNQA